MSDEWYWDLDKGRAVTASERGRDANTLGPFANKAAAENWQANVERRNESWDEADEEWNSWGESDSE